MGSKTKIEWCDASWNPVTGCLHGCEYCYARRIAERFDGKMDECNPLHPSPLHELNEAARKGMITAGGEVITRITPYPFGFEPTFHRYRLDILRHWVRPKTIFVCSMADLFGAWVPEEWIIEVFETCRKYPQHRYLFLTKNPKRLGELASKGILPEDDNFWWGSSLDNKNALRYPGRLLDHTFLSIEPLTEYMDVGLGSFGSAEWIIIGAETGNRKERVIPQWDWIDNTCKAAAITQAAVFMKDSLIPIVGEANMRREFPWEKKNLRTAGKEAGEDAAQPTIMYGA